MPRPRPSRKLLIAALALSILPVSISLYWYRINSRINALAEACWDGNVENARTLLSQGVDPNAKASVYTYRDEKLINIAVSRGWAEIVKLILDAGVKPDVDLVFRALQCGNHEVTLLVLEHGPALDMNVPPPPPNYFYPPIAMITRTEGTILDSTPIDATHPARSIVVVRELIQHKADVNAKSAGGATALMGAVKGDHPEMVKELLDHHASIDDKDGNGSTALSLAVSQNSSKAIRILLDHGASVSVNPDKLRLALTFVVKRNRSEITSMLKAAGFTP